MRNRGSLLGLPRLNRAPVGVKGLGRTESDPVALSRSTGGMMGANSTGGMGRTGTGDMSRSISRARTMERSMAGATPAGPQKHTLVTQMPGMTSNTAEKKARMHAKALHSLLADESSRLIPGLSRSTAHKPRMRRDPPMWDRATLSSTVQPTAYPCDPRDEKTWMGTTGYPLVYPGDHRHEWTTVEYQGRDYPRRPWKLTHTRCLSLEQSSADNNRAADSFDMQRPQNTTCEVQPRAPRWKPTGLGDKLTLEGCEEVKKAADGSAWETLRPVQFRPPPWAHVEAPRARFVTASVMSASPWQ